MIQRNDERLTTHRILQGLCFVWFVVALATPVAASSPDEKAEPMRQAPEAASTEAATGPPVAAAAVMKVSVDGETGEIRLIPPREPAVLSAPLATALSRSTEGLRVFELSNGGKGVHLQGRFQHVLMVRVKPDGSFETICTNHPHEAEVLASGESAGGDAEPRDR